MQALVSSVNLCESQFFIKKWDSKSPSCFPLSFVLRITEIKDLKNVFNSNFSQSTCSLRSSLYSRSSRILMLMALFISENHRP